MWVWVKAERIKKNRIKNLVTQCTLMYSVYSNLFMYGFDPTPISTWNCPVNWYQSQITLQNLIGFLVPWGTSCLWKSHERSDNSHLPPTSPLRQATPWGARDSAVPMRDSNAASQLSKLCASAAWRPTRRTWDFSWRNGTFWVSKRAKKWKKGLNPTSPGKIDGSAVDFPFLLTSMKGYW